MGKMAVFDHAKSAKIDYTKIRVPGYFQMKVTFFRKLREINTFDI